MGNDVQAVACQDVVSDSSWLLGVIPGSDGSEVGFGLSDGLLLSRSRPLCLSLALDFFSQVMENLFHPCQTQDLPKTR